MALENKLGITDSAELARVEEKLSKAKALQLFESGLLETIPVGSFEGLAMIHKYLFEDIYDLEIGFMEKTTIKEIKSISGLSKEVLDLRTQAEEELKKLNTALEDLFEYVQDVVYFEQTGKHRKQEEEKQQPVEQSVAPEETVQPILQESKTEEAPKQTPTVEQKTETTVQTNEKTPENIDVNLPKKFIIKEETIKEEIQTQPVVQETEIKPVVIEETKTQIVEEPAVVVEEEKEVIKVPLLVEIEDDYASRPTISGSITRRGAKTQDKEKTQNTSTPLLRPLKGQVAIEGTVNRK